MVEWSGDALDEQLYSAAREAALAYLVLAFGPRCPDFNEHCPQCRTWAAFDVMFGETIE